MRRCLEYLETDLCILCHYVRGFICPFNNESKVAFEGLP